MITADAARALKPGSHGDIIDNAIRLSAAHSSFVEVSRHWLPDGELDRWITGIPSPETEGLRDRLIRAGYRVRVNNPLDTRPEDGPPAMSAGYVRICW